ncbi:MAG: hypothetical protein UZ01_03607 [Candidatus Brocadia sinica]|nr:MAG: hypothetical protein UZ01_03607 [Candidatus Brocadia sinica]
MSRKLICVIEEIVYIDTSDLVKWYGEMMEN